MEQRNRQSGEAGELGLEPDHTGYVTGHEVVSNSPYPESTSKELAHCLFFSRFDRDLAQWNLELINV